MCLQRATADSLEVDRVDKINVEHVAGGAVGRVAMRSRVTVVLIGV